MANVVRILAGDFAGNVRGEIAAQPEEISWRLNDVGRVRFYVGNKDANLQAGWYDPGNTLLLQFSNGLPAWGGVIDLPRRWQENVVEINAYSAEYVLGWRYTDKGRYFDGASPGAIFQALITEGNAVEDTGITLGTVYTGGDSHSPEYHLDQALRIVRESVVGRLSDFDFAVIPALSNGRITFTANFYQQRGGTKEAALVEGRNLTGISLDEQGPVVNDVTIAGADVSGEGNDGWGAGRLIASDLDQTSINAYRRRMYGAVFNDVSIQATLDGHAQRLIDDGATPHNLWGLTALDLAPARFADYDVGDTVRLQAPTFGVGGTNTRVRVLGRDYRLDSGTCALVVREV